MQGLFQMIGIGSNDNTLGWTPFSNQQELK